MTNERKRELERKLDVIVMELRKIVEEMDYGISLMVLPSENSSSVSAFIHECKGDNGIMSIPQSFMGALDAKFDYGDDEGE